MKKILLNICIAVILVAVAFASGAYFQQQRYEKQRAALLAQRVSQDEKRENEPTRPWVRTVPGTDAEMLSAGYWKTSVSGELLFSEDEIRYYQNNNPLFVSYYDEPAGKTVKLRMYDLPEQIGAHAVKALINPDYIDERSDGTVTVYVNGQTPAEGYWDGIRGNCALELIPENVSPRYCVCVKRDLAMAVPTDDFASESADEIYCNDFISAEVMPFTGVVALHESLDKERCFIINGSYCGWVKKDSLAFCADRDQWLQAVRPGDYLTVTACEITLDETAHETRTESLVLPMGTRIKLLCGYDGLVDGRETYGCYVTMIPCRDDNGALDWETVLIPVSKDVVVGSLPMTSGAVLDQAFKFLGKIYGWGGSFSSNDCSGIVRQVYACFGIELPRNSAAIAEIYDLGGRGFSVMTSDKKLDIIKKMPAGTLLAMDGHLMIYLGTVGDKPYVISSCATFFPPEDASGVPSGAYGIIVSDLGLLRENGKTWLDSLSYFQLKEY